MRTCEECRYSKLISPGFRGNREVAPEAPEFGCKNKWGLLNLGLPAVMDYQEIAEACDEFSLPLDPAEDY